MNCHRPRQDRGQNQDRGESEAEPASLGLLVHPRHSKSRRIKKPRRSGASGNSLYGGPSASSHCQTGSPCHILSQAFKRQWPTRFPSNEPRWPLRSVASARRGPVLDVGRRSVIDGWQGLGVGRRSVVVGARWRVEFRGRVIRFGRRRIDWGTHLTNGRRTVVSMSMAALRRLAALCGATARRTAAAAAPRRAAARPENGHRDDNQVNDSSGPHGMHSGGRCLWSATRLDRARTRPFARRTPTNRQIGLELSGDCVGQSHRSGDARHSQLGGRSVSKRRIGGSGLAAATCRSPATTPLQPAQPDRAQAALAWQSPCYHVVLAQQKRRWPRGRRLSLFFTSQRGHSPQPWASSTRC